MNNSSQSPREKSNFFFKLITENKGFSGYFLRTIPMILLHEIQVRKKYPKIVLPYNDVDKVELEIKLLIIKHIKDK